MRGCLIADIAEPHRVELVQRRHGPARIPPLRAEPGELLHLVRVDARSAGIPINHLNSCRFRVRKVAAMQPGGYLYAPFYALNSAAGTQLTVMARLVMKFGGTSVA